MEAYSEYDEGSPIDVLNGNRSDLHDGENAHP